MRLKGAWTEPILQRAFSWLIQCLCLYRGNLAASARFYKYNDDDLQYHCPIAQLLLFKYFTSGGQLNLVFFNLQSLRISSSNVLLICFAELGQSLFLHRSLAKIHPSHCKALQVHLSLVIYMILQEWRNLELFGLSKQEVWTFCHYVANIDHPLSRPNHLERQSVSIASTTSLRKNLYQERIELRPCDTRIFHTYIHPSRCPCRDSNTCTCASPGDSIPRWHEYSRPALCLVYQTHVGVPTSHLLSLNRDEYGDIQVPLSLRVFTSCDRSKPDSETPGPTENGIGFLSNTVIGTWSTSPTVRFLLRDLLGYTINPPTTFGMSTFFRHHIHFIHVSHRRLSGTNGYYSNQSSSILIESGAVSQLRIPLFPHTTTYPIHSPRLSNAHSTAISQNANRQVEGENQKIRKQSSYVSDLS